MKKIVIIPDSFKGTMSSIEVCEIIENAIKNILPEAEVIKIPVADGGEGTVDAFIKAMGGEKVFTKVKGPLFTNINAFYGVLSDGKTAVIEMAAASGLPLAGEDKNPCKATTYGTGQLISAALDRGYRKIIIGIGGSATNDAGIGAASALGVKFLDDAGKEVSLNGEGLEKIARIDTSGLDKRVLECEIVVACDVANPLYGPNGAAHIFAPQKGADIKMVEYLDKNLMHYAEIIKKEFEIDLQSIAGTGAAGGLGASLIVFAKAVLQPGIRIILDCVKFDEVIKDADLIITGEGKIDGQSLNGKVPIGVADRALKQKIPVIAVVGDIGDDIELVYDRGISAVFSINKQAIPFEKAKLRCKSDLKETVETLIRFAKVLKTQRDD